MSIGQNVARLRKEKKIVQEDLAKKAKVSHPFLSQIESGKRGCSVETLAKLAKALGVTPNDLMK